jgi:hypothetical protein
MVERCSNTRTAFKWVSLFFIALSVASCGDDEPASVTPEKDAASSNTKAPEPVVREWYPSPRHLAPQYVPGPIPAPAPQNMQRSQPYNTIPYKQSRVMQPSYTYAQGAQQQFAGSPVPVYPAGQPQQFQTTPQYQYATRPWGEMQRRDNRDKRKQTQSAIVPEETYPYYYGTGTTTWGTPPVLPQWDGGIYGSPYPAPPWGIAW